MSLPTMSASRRGEMEVLTETAKILFYAPVGSAEVKKLTIRDQIVRVDDSAYTCTIVLPNVSEAAGLTFEISVVTGTYNCTVTDSPNGYADNIDSPLDLVLTAAEDKVVLISNGRSWRLLVDDTT